MKTIVMTRLEIELKFLFRFGKIFTVKIHLRDWLHLLICLLHYCVQIENCHNFRITYDTYDKDRDSLKGWLI